jgi:hypothetical protein
MVIPRFLVSLRTVLAAATFIAAAAVASVATAAPASAPAPAAAPLALEAGFDTPPDSVRVGTYWYWTDDGVTKQGIIDDLHAMKRAGVTRAFIGLIGGGNRVKFMSEQWWDLIRIALKTATELDIEIGMFNCPGWSQSGGPWIKPEQSMRYLAASQTQVSGPAKIKQKLALPEKVNLKEMGDAILSSSYQDVKVLAFPVKTENLRNLFASPDVKIIHSGNISVTQQKETPFPRYKLPKQTEASFVLTLPNAVSAQSFVINNTGRFSADGELQIKDGNRYKTIRRFNINHLNSNRTISLGFQPYAPVVLSFPEVKTTEYKVIFRNTTWETEAVITGFSLTRAPIIERYPEKTFAKLFNKYAPPWDAYMWETQTAETALSIDPQNVLDISKYMAADGTLSWDAPAGNWIILRTGMVPTGSCNSPNIRLGGGHEVDKIDGKLVAWHFDSFLGKILQRIPEAERKSFKVNVMDSWEKGGQNFSDNFSEIFKQRYGYDPTPYLPAYYGFPVGSPERSDRFLWDMRRLVADRISYEYIGTMRKKSAENGLTTWLETYGTWGFAGEFLQYGGQSDEVSGEFWTGMLSEIGVPEMRCGSSAAHTYGKTKVWAEAFTSADKNYQRYPGAIKQLGDSAFAQGINAYILHVNIQQQSNNSFPGTDAWYGIEFNRKNTWFSQLDLFTTYARRCGFMLQQGLDVADVAYFIGEDAPKMSGITQPSTPDGYHYDHINGEVLLRDATVKDGKLLLPHGTSYRVLVLPPQETMRPAVLRKIKQLVADGAIVVGSPPSRSPSLENYPAADKEVRELAGELWGATPQKQRAYGKGKVFTNTGLEEIFQMLNLPPDFLADKKSPILYTHRKTADADIYFVTNQSDKRIQVTPQFRVTGKQPELWEPVTAERRLLPAFVQNGATTAVPLQLEPAGSAFVVFRKSAAQTKSSAAVEINFPEPEVVAEIKSPWVVQFESDAIKRGPEKPVVFNALTDWSKNADPQIRYFSGTAVYKTKVDSAVLKSLTQKGAGAKIWLDLGKVGVMAKVKINGKPAGGVWTYPYRVEITPFVTGSQSEIEVEIEVVNTWANRIVGDKSLPGAQRKLHLSGIAGGGRGPSALQEAGLLGSVKILTVGGLQASAKNALLGTAPKVADTSEYLRELREELKKKHPANRLINIVFRGHSVPSGYFKTPEVRSLQAFPHLVFQAVKEEYVFARVNSIVAALGQGNAEYGAKFFKEEVLMYKPDVVFIDYALNDRFFGLDRARKGWESMIEQAKAANVKVILMTPTPDTRESILDKNTRLAQHASQIRELAAKHNVGLVDSYAAFESLVRKGEKLGAYMSQINHPNEKGHKVVCELIMRWLSEKK